MTGHRAFISASTRVFDAQWTTANALVSRPSTSSIWLRNKTWMPATSAGMTIQPDLIHAAHGGASAASCLQPRENIDEASASRFPAGARQRDGAAGVAAFRVRAKLSAAAGA